MSSARSATGRSHSRRPLVIGLLALVAAGCQSKGNLSGKVTYKGKPLVYGQSITDGCVDFPTTLSMLHELADVASRRTPGMAN